MNRPPPCSRSVASVVGNEWPVRMKAPISSSAIVRNGATTGIETLAARYAIGASSESGTQTARTRRK